MKAWELIAMVLCILYFGIGLGSIMRIERKLSAGIILKVFFITPIFVLGGFVIWTVHAIHEISIDKKVKVRFIVTMYRAYFQFMPYMCEAFIHSIIGAKEKRESSVTGTMKNAKHIFQKGYEFILEEGYV